MHGYSIESWRVRPLARLQLGSLQYANGRRLDTVSTVYRIELDLLLSIMLSRSVGPVSNADSGDKCFTKIPSAAEHVAFYLLHLFCA